MQDREIAVVVSNDNENVSVYETIDAIKKAGFKNVFIQWYNKEWNPTQEEQLKYIRNHGLNVIFAHLGYQNINNLWLEGEEGNKLVDRYINDIKVCKENNIPMVVMHLTSKSVAPKYNEIGLSRLRNIVNYAEALNIKVAFENTKIKGYLDYVIENIDNKNVGICFDSGHYHAHFNDEFDFKKFKNRIFAVHFHDNDQTDDLHLLPFDGTLDWKKIIKNLKENNYTGPITMELCYRYNYLEMNVKDFYKKGFEIGKKLSDIYNNKFEFNELNSFIKLNLNLLENEISKINIDKVIDCITIFPENERNYKEFNELLSKDGKIVDKMSSGNLYKLFNGINTEYGILNFIKVRKYEEKYVKYRISVDFVIDNYDEYKNKSNNLLIKKYDTFELVQHKTADSIINVVSLSASEEYKYVENKIFYDSTDNIKLCGLLSKVNDSNKIVILCHGLKADKTERNSFNTFVKKLQNKNINSFRFDFRGHGESSGNDYEMTPTKEVQDLENTIKFLNDKGYSEIIILGASFGGSIISLIDYNKFNSVKGLISWYGALDYLATIEEDNFFSKEHKEFAEQNGYYEIISKRTGKSFKLGHELYKEIYSIVPYKELIKVNLPILFVHGLCDKMVPYELSVKASKMCKNSKLELIENGDHTFDNDIIALNKAIDVSVDFIENIF